jgi:hypothetical protein
MGSTRKQRVASFDVYKVKRVRTFKPINKRAKTYANALGLRKGEHLSVKQIKQIRTLGKHRVVVYDNPLSTHFTVVKV